MISKITKFIVHLFSNMMVFKFPLFVLLGGYGYGIKAKDQRELFDILNPGDILLRRYHHYFTGLLIPGYWTHAAIYVGNDEIIHVIQKGICKEDILMFTRTDDIIVLRPKDQSRCNEAIDTARSKLIEGIEYDYAFSSTPDKFYCSEFVKYCYNWVNVNSKISKYILPDDFLSSPDLEIVWEKGV